jgi:NAD(P)H-dependent flavin oxidoreductase YrpB (nitropropane dioxygenase family)
MGTRFLLTQESPVPQATKQRYLDCRNPAEIIVSTALDGMPQRMILNEFLSSIEKANPVRKLILAAGNGLKYRALTGASFLSLFQSALAMAKDDDMTLSQAMFSANAPMIIQKAMVEGLHAEGVLPSGQVAGTIDDLPTCAELIGRIVLEAEERLAFLANKVS